MVFKKQTKKEIEKVLNSAELKMLRTQLKSLSPSKDKQVYIKLKTRLLELEELIEKINYHDFNRYDVDVITSVMENLKKRGYGSFALECLTEDNHQLYRLWFKRI